MIVAMEVKAPQLGIICDKYEYICNLLIWIKILQYHVLSYHLTVFANKRRIGKWLNSNFAMFYLLHSWLEFLSEKKYHFLEAVSR